MLCLVSSLPLYRIYASAVKNWRSFGEALQKPEEIFSGTNCSEYTLHSCLSNQNRNLNSDANVNIYTLVNSSFKIPYFMSLKLKKQLLFIATHAFLSQLFKSLKQVMHAI